MKARWIEFRIDMPSRPKTFYSFYVTGQGMFPIDMLRHDSCWPATSGDAAKIEWGFTISGRRKTRSIKMYSHRAPTVDRWSSFCWSVGVESLEPVS